LVFSPLCLVLWGVVGPARGVPAAQTKLRASGDERLTAKVISWASPADILRVFREVLAA